MHAHLTTKGRRRIGQDENFQNGEGLNVDQKAHPRPRKSNLSRLRRIDQSFRQLLRSSSIPRERGRKSLCERAGLCKVLYHHLDVENVASVD